MPDSFNEDSHWRKRLRDSCYCVPQLTRTGREAFCTCILHLFGISADSLTKILCINHSILLPERPRRYHELLLHHSIVTHASPACTAPGPSELAVAHATLTPELTVGCHLTSRVMATPLHVWARLWLQAERPPPLFRSGVTFWSILQSSSSMATFWLMLQSCLSSFPSDCVHLMLVHLVFEYICQLSFLHFLPRQVNNSAPDWLPC